MAETLPPTPDEIDEMLAKFTDQVLAETVSDPAATPNEAELLELQKMVILLNQVAKHRQPTEVQSKKIWGNLAAQWRKNGVATHPESLWQRLERRVNALQSDLLSGDRRSLYATGAALAIVIVLVILTPGLSNFDTPLPGAAGAGDGLMPFIILAGLVGVGVIWWWLRRKR